MLDRPPAPDDGLFGVGCFVRRENFIDCGITDRMRGHAPTEAVELLDDRRVGFLLERIDAEIFSTVIVRLLIELRHPTALETAVNGQLDAADAQPLVSFVWFYVIGGEHFRLACGIGCGWPQQLVHANRKQTLFLQLLQSTVLLDACAGVPNRRQTRCVELLVLFKKISWARLRFRR